MISHQLVQSKYSTVYVQYSVSTVSLRTVIHSTLYCSGYCGYLYYKVLVV